MHPTRLVLLAFALSLPLGCRDAYAPDPANDAPAAADVPANVPATSAGDGTRWTGTFGGLAGHRGSGRVTVTIDTGGLAVIELQPDFSLDPQPDPHLYVNTAPTVHDGRPIRIGTLQASRGAQRYVVRLPRGAAYTHVVIWCNRYDVGLAQASLLRVPSS